MWVSELTEQTSTEGKDAHEDALGLAHADLTERVADAMQSVSRAYVAALVDALGKEGLTGLTPATVSLLARITAAGSQTVDLARQTRRTKQATGKLVAELEFQEFVERVPDPKDGRAQLVRLTTKGQEALTVGATVKANLAQRAMTILGAETMERLYEDLARLEDVLRDDS